MMEQLRDLHLRMYRLFNERMRAQGASLAQIKLLLLIERGGSVRSTDICDALGQAPRTVTEAVDGLEREGLAVRNPDPDDRRAKRISLTEAGRALIREVEPHKDAFTAQFFEVLTDADQASFLRILETLNDRLVDMGAPRALGGPTASTEGSTQQ
ncbi:DNA-binding MarR family transcriptional regulator [Novosphingobium sp. PhB165]|uniref:MarR family winged helix-turn-helix transcriptional regulator n=1 Tax=Novosphingobium sp. PhB165 TaxID=2485105 RepID=UPI00104BF284|nr:MarR family winged helix-turn-helix transcriptional regulator [Novosphingobium sp. PhB165]TCM15728.1 DNA-binding MarR family transcriptional regulator [Novosphingobium sp. PhB165]